MKNTHNDGRTKALIRLQYFICWTISPESCRAIIQMQQNIRSKSSPEFLKNAGASLTPFTFFGFSADGIITTCPFKSSARYYADDQTML